MNSGAPAVGIVMGSQSDWETMRHAADTLTRLGVAHEVRIVSAHRTPRRLYEFAEAARGRGLKVVIAGAGGAAHLPGMVAALTPLPVFGVPIESHALKGMDSLLSIVQMPGGVPVGTLAIGKAVCRIVRRLEVGFAVQFVTPIERDDVEETVRAPHEWDRAMRRLEGEVAAEVEAPPDSQMGEVAAGYAI